jgi:hypothetical protein
MGMAVPCGIVKMPVYCCAGMKKTLKEVKNHNNKNKKCGWRVVVG